MLLICRSLRLSSASNPFLSWLDASFLYFCSRRTFKMIFSSSEVIARNIVIFVIYSVCNWILVIDGNTNMALMCRTACVTASTVPVRAPGETAKRLGLPFSITRWHGWVWARSLWYAFTSRRSEQSGCLCWVCWRRNGKMWLDFFPHLGIVVRGWLRAAIPAALSIYWKLHRDLGQLQLLSTL